MAEDETPYFLVADGLSSLQSNLEKLLIHEVSLPEGFDTFVKLQDLTIAIEKRPILVLEVRGALNCQEVNQNQLIAQKESVVDELSIFSKDVVSSRERIHHARQDNFLSVALWVILTIPVYLSLTVLYSHEMALSEWNLANCQVLDLFEVLRVVKLLEHLRSTDKKWILVLIFQVKVVKTFIAGDNQVIIREDRHLLVVSLVSFYASLHRIEIFDDR